MIAMENYLTPKDIQEKLHCGKNKIYQILNQKDFPKVKIGRRYLVSESAFQDYMNRKIGKEIYLK